MPKNRRRIPCTDAATGLPPSSSLQPPTPSPTTRIAAASTVGAGTASMSYGVVEDVAQRPYVTSVGTPRISSWLVAPAWQISIVRYAASIEGRCRSSPI